MSKRNKKEYAFPKMIKYFKNIKKELILFTIILAVSVSVDVLNPIVIGNMVNFLSLSDFCSALTFACVLFFLMLVKNFFGRTLNYLAGKKIKNNLMYNIRKDMVKSVLNMKVSVFDKHSSGEFSERLKNDPDNIFSIISCVQYSLICSVAGIAMICYVTYLSPIIGGLYVLCLITIFFYEKSAFSSYEKLNKLSKEKSDKCSSLLNETIRGIRDIKLLNIANKIFPIINTTLSDTTNIESDIQIKREDIYIVDEIIQNVFLALIILTGILMVSLGDLSLSSLIVIFMYRTEIFGLMLAFTTIKEYSIKFEISSKRIFEIIDSSKYSKEEFGSNKLKNINGKIDIKNLSFAYDSKKDVLKNINLSIDANKTIGIVGESGSGKTTILNLLTKAYEVEDGHIFIDDVDINTLDVDSIRNNISIVSQNPYLFNLSIKDNLKLIGSNITNKDMIEACKIAQIHDYIDSLPDKYDTVLGEGGLVLSGGERQRLSIARALLKKSKIIVFDEATSALDNVTQSEFQKAIKKLKNDYTMIIVAHRLSTIKDCDEIYVLNKGKLVESGTHKFLFENGKVYKKLYENDENN